MDVLFEVSKVSTYLLLLPPKKKNEEEKDPEEKKEEDERREEEEMMIVVERRRTAVAILHLGLGGNRSSIILLPLTSYLIMTYRTPSRMNE